MNYKKESGVCFGSCFFKILILIKFLTFPKKACRILYICSVKFLFPIFAFLIVFQPAFPVVEYVLNYDYISKELCENKDRPELACNGKCYLMQALAEASEQESQQKKETLAKKVEIPLLYAEKQLVLNTSMDTEVIAHNFSAKPQFYQFYSLQDFFHPPII